MCIRKFFVFFVLLLSIVGNQAISQIKKSPRSSAFSVPHITRKKAVVMCPIFENSRYPYQGIGIKLGDPFAFTYKLYLNKHQTVVVDFGKSASGLYSIYYRDLFHGYKEDMVDNVLRNDPQIDPTNKEQIVKYITHTALQDWLLEAKWLHQWNLDRLSKGLQVYAGLGCQLRQTVLQYEYIYFNGNKASDESKYAKNAKSRFVVGPVAIIGFEYSYFNLPISAFIEFEMFTDAYLDLGYRKFQGGVGLRYVF